MTASWLLSKALRKDCIGIGYHRLKLNVKNEKVRINNKILKFEVQKWYIYVHTFKFV